MHSGRKHISIIERYHDVLNGPSPEQIARSLHLVGSPSLCKFILAPKSRNGSSQVIYGRVQSVRVLSQDGPSWSIVLTDIGVQGESAVVDEKQLQIYYHASGKGVINAGT